jgi:hypothetical protein
VAEKRGLRSGGEGFVEGVEAGGQVCQSLGVKFERFFALGGGFSGGDENGEELSEGGFDVFGDVTGEEVVEIGRGGVEFVDEFPFGGVECVFG